MDESWKKVHSFSFQKAFTYADMRPGHKDKEKRNYIRKAAFEGFLQNTKTESAKWAFKIYVKKSGKRAFDIENVPKLIIDAFCEKQIEKDKAGKYRKVGLYRDDTIDHVVFLEVRGTRIDKEEDERTQVEIYRLKK